MFLTERIDFAGAAVGAGVGATAAAAVDIKNRE
jgi:hypothetical protein